MTPMNEMVNIKNGELLGGCAHNRAGVAAFV